MTPSLSGSTSIIFSLSSRSISDLDGFEAILWLDWLGVDKIMGCWLLFVDGSSYRKSLLSDTGRIFVGEDVFSVGGGVFFVFVEWFGFLDDCRWGCFCGFMFRMTLHSISMQILDSKICMVLISINQTILQDMFCDY